MEKAIKYTSFYTAVEHNVLFKNLLEDGDNVDKRVREGTLFTRPDLVYIYNALLKLLKPGDAIWDIGAYIGSFAIPFAIEGMDVHAFEGFPSNYERLRANCNPYKNINTYMCALGNENKKVTSKFGDCTNVTQSAVELEYFIFDEYIKKHNIPFPKLIKMDIEGMESLALLGMSNVLNHVRPIWQIGFHHPGNILIDNPDQKIDGYPGFVIPEEGGFDFETFAKLGYYVYDLKRARESKFLWGDCNGEYLCIPKEQLGKVL
tara:strand:- start:1035 stop:1817 length:783 start_codon:yes stop_codon:yes gene_type:complete